MKPWCQKLTFLFWLNRDPCTSLLEPLEKVILVYYCFLDHWAPHICHWNVHQHCWNSAFLDLEVWAQANFLSALLGALLIANLGKNVFLFLWCSTACNVMLTEIAIIRVIFLLTPNHWHIKLYVNIFSCIRDTQCLHMCKTIAHEELMTYPGLVSNNRSTPCTFSWYGL